MPTMRVACTLWCAAGRLGRQVDRCKLVAVNEKHVFVVPGDLVVWVLGKSGVHVSADSLRSETSAQGVGFTAAAAAAGAGSCSSTSGMHQQGRKIVLQSAAGGAHACLGRGGQRGAGGHQKPACEAELPASKQSQAHKHNIAFKHCSLTVMPKRSAKKSWISRETTRGPPSQLRSAPGTNTRPSAPGVAAGAAARGARSS